MTADDNKSEQAGRPDAARDAARRLRSFAEGAPIDEVPELIRLADLAASCISDPAVRAKAAENLMASLTVLRLGPKMGVDPDDADAARLQALKILKLLDKLLEADIS